jgi:hypothetical protein
MLWWSNAGGWDGKDMWHVCGRRKIMDTGFWCRNLNTRHHMENLGVDWRTILKWI